MPIYRKGIQYRDPDETFFGTAQPARQQPSENSILRRRCLARMQANSYDFLVLPIIEEIPEK